MNRHIFPIRSGVGTNPRVAADSNRGYCCKNGSRDLFTKNSVYCCLTEHPAKVYELPTHARWKRLYFLDECPFCHNTVASLQICDLKGNIKVLSRKTNKEAEKLRDKVLRHLEKRIFKPLTGSLENERLLFNNKGIVFNFNNRRVGKNEDFIFSMT